MPKVILTSELLKELSAHAGMGRINKLKIARYKTGANAGKLFAEYSLKTESLATDTESARKSIARFLRNASDVMRDGQLKEIFVLKTGDKETYVHSFEQIKSNESESL